MNRSILAHLILLACGLSSLHAQYIGGGAYAGGTSTGGNSSSPPTPPSGGTCSGDCSSSHHVSASSQCGDDETFAPDSINCSFGVGTTTYATKSTFVDQEVGERQPHFAFYNPPSLDTAPFASSLASEWKGQSIRPVTIGLVREDITDAIFTPAYLELYGANAGNAWVKKDASGALRQVLTDQYLTDITSSNGAVLVNSYFRASVGGLDSSTGLYTIPSSAKYFRTIRISRPTTTGLDTLDILKKDYSSSQTAPKIRGHRWVKSGTGSTVTWAFSRHSGEPTGANVIDSNTLVKQDLGGGLIQRTRTIGKIAGATTVVTSITRDKYRDVGGGVLRIFESVDAPGFPEELTTSYTYTDATGTGTVGLSGTITAPATGAPVNNLIGGRLHSLQRSDGYWEQYAYQYNGGTRIMLTEKWSSWKDSAFGDKVNSRHSTIVLEEKSRTVTEQIAGQTVSSEHETLTTLADGSRVLRAETSLNAQEKAVTENAYFADNAPVPNNGRIQYTRHPDGTLTRYTYSTVADPTLSGASALKTITEIGTTTDLAYSTTTPAVGTGPVPALTRGTRTETLKNTFNKIISSKTCDIFTNQILDQSAAVAVDDVGRPTKVVFDGDPNDFTETTFACCGIKTQRGRDGSLTDFTKDELERPTFTTVTLGSRVSNTGYAYTTETVAGRALLKSTVTRSVVGTSGSLLVSESVVNYRNQSIIRRAPDADGDGNPEETRAAESINATGRSTVTTDPLNNESSRTIYPDGQLKSSATTGMAPTTYAYAPHALNGGGIQTTATTGATVITTFADRGGRVVRTDTPGYNGATLVTTFTFDQANRVTATTSTGKPATTTTAYDVLGKSSESWTDANGDGAFNDTAVDGIKDTYQRRESLIVNESGPLQRTRTWVRNDANDDILLSTKYGSPDGRYTKTVPLTGSVTVTAATKPLNGARSSQTQTFLTATQYLTQTTATAFNANGTSTTVTVKKDTMGATLTTATQIADPFGRALSLSDGRTPATTYGNYTPAGLPGTITDGGGNVTTRSYDKLGRPVTTDLPDTTDAAGNTLYNITHTSYHPSGQIVAQWGDQTTATWQGYDSRGRKTTLKTFRTLAHNTEPTDSTPDADTTTWIFEPSTGLLTRKQYADTKGTDYTYTADGKLHSRTWARGVATLYDYTPAGQLKLTDYSDATPDASIAYDRLGRQINISNGLAQSHFEYVGLSLDTETISYNLDGQPGFEFTRVLDRSQDDIGRDQGWQLKNGTTVEYQATYGYSATDGRFSSVVGGGDVASPQTFSYGYTPNSNLIESVTGPIHTATNIWEPNRDVLDYKQNKVGSTVISQYDYAVNAIGQRESVATSGSAFPATPSWAWGYDSLGQFARANSSVDAYDRAYQYDAIGNRKKSANSLTLPTDDTYGTNNLNQYSAIGSLAPAYDFDGNATTYPLPIAPATNSSLTWDAENRLVATQVGTSGPLVRYLYDVQSRRIAKSVTTGGSAGPTTLYLYDNWNRIAEYTGTTPTLAKTYLWGLDLSGSTQGAGGVGGLLAVSEISNSPISNFYPTFDGNGNVSEYLTSAATFAAHFEYDPFGNTVVNTDSAELFTYRFSTKPLDSETGLYYYGYRYYDPVTGRWPSRDPIEEQGGKNLYVFVRNCVTDRWDILGCSEDCDDCNGQSKGDKTATPSAPYTSNSNGETSEEFANNFSTRNGLGLAAAAGGLQAGSAATPSDAIEAGSAAGGYFTPSPNYANLVNGITATGIAVDQYERGFWKSVKVHCKECSSCAICKKAWKITNEKVYTSPVPRRSWSSSQLEQLKEEAKKICDE